MANTYINIPATSSSDVFYINTKKRLQADIITTPNKAIFTGAQILQPTAYLPSTSVGNFEFYINRQYIPSTLVSFVSTGSSVEILFNTSSIGFGLETTDEIIAIGKFQ
jgi:hypothetical protein